VSGECRGIRESGEKRNRELRKVNKREKRRKELV
jgi:hypothetical protein